MLALAEIARLRSAADGTWRHPNDYDQNHDECSSYDVPCVCRCERRDWDPNEGGQATTTDRVKITVLETDLDILNVPDEQEEDPGGFVGVGGLIQLQLRQVLPNTLPHTDKATLTWNAEDKIDGFENGDRTGQISSGQQYELHDLPKTVYVEGDVASDFRDVVIELTYTKGGCTASDTVKLTVVGVNLVVDGVDEGHEIDPGAFVRLNTDDDNQNSQEDTQDAPNPQEDDLVGMTLSVSPAGIEGNVNLFAISGAARIKVWQSATKTGTEVTLPPNPLWTTANMPTQLYLEGYFASNNPRDVELVLEYSGHDMTAQDHAKVTVVDVDLDIDGVAEAEEENPGGFAAVNGSRKRILLAAFPPTVGPVTLDVVAGDTKVELWDSSAGGVHIGERKSSSTPTSPDMRCAASCAS